jgi:hypothetical protein
VSWIRIALKQKNSPGSQVSFLYGVKNLKQTITDLSAPVCTGMDVAPYSPWWWRLVAKASSGQFPLPFLISDLKNWLQR